MRLLVDSLEPPGTLLFTSKKTHDLWMFVSLTRSISGFNPQPYPGPEISRNRKWISHESNCGSEPKTPTGMGYEKFPNGMGQDSRPILTNQILVYFEYHMNIGAPTFDSHSLEGPLIIWQISSPKKALMLNV